MVLCGVAGNAGAAAAGALTGRGYWAELERYLTRGAGGAAWGPGDLLFSFLPVIILCFGFKIFGQWTVLRRHWPEVVGARAGSAAFSLFSTAAPCRLLRLPPGALLGTGRGAGRRPFGGCSLISPLPATAPCRGGPRPGAAVGDDGAGAPDRGAAGGGAAGDGGGRGADGCGGRKSRPPPDGCPRLLRPHRLGPHRRGHGPRPRHRGAERGARGPALCGAGLRAVRRGGDRAGQRARGAGGAAGAGGRGRGAGLALGRWLACTLLYCSLVTSDAVPYRASLNVEEGPEEGPEMQETPRRYQSGRKDERNSERDIVGSPKMTQSIIVMIRASSKGGHL